MALTLSAALYEDRNDVGSEGPSMERALQKVKVRVWGVR